MRSGIAQRAEQGTVARAENVLSKEDAQLPFGLEGAADYGHTSTLEYRRNYFEFLSLEYQDLFFIFHFQELRADQLRADGSGKLRA